MWFHFQIFRQKYPSFREAQPNEIHIIAKQYDGLISCEILTSPTNWLTPRISDYAHQLFVIRINRVKAVWRPFGQSMHTVAYKRGLISAFDGMYKLIGLLERLTPEIN